MGARELLVASIIVYEPLPSHCRQEETLTRANRQWQGARLAVAGGVVAAFVVRAGDIARLVNNLDKEARPRPTGENAGPNLGGGVKGQILGEETVGIVGIDVGHGHLADAGSIGGSHLHLHLTLVAKETIHQVDRRRRLVGAVVIEDFDG